jgi:hypothetical protein
MTANVVTVTVTVNAGTAQNSGPLSRYSPLLHNEYEKKEYEVNVGKL